MKKKIIIYITIAVVIIIIATISIIGLVQSKNNKKIKNKTIEENIVENVIANEIKENNTIVENTVNEIIAEEIQEEVEEENTETINVSELKTQESNKDTAIQIAKDDWGSDGNVYFRLDSIDSNGKYIIEVRKKSTTEILTQYKIDVNTKTFVKE